MFIMYVREIVLEYYNVSVSRQQIADDIYTTNQSPY